MEFLLLVEAVMAWIRTEVVGPDYMQFLFKFVQKTTSQMCIIARVDLMSEQDVCEETQAKGVTSRLKLVGLPVSNCMGKNEMDRLEAFRNAALNHEAVFKQLDDLKMLGGDEWME